MSSTVFYINTPTYTGGAEISLLTLMRHLDPERYKPLLLTSGEGQLAEAARGYDLEILIQDFTWFRKRYPWRFAGSILTLANTLNRHKVTLVHTNCDHSLRYVMRACQVRRLPYVSHVRDFVRSWFQPENVRALNRAEFVIANSHAVASACIEAGVDQERLQVIYNPIQTEVFRQARSIDLREVRHELDLPIDGYIVGIIGQIQPIKGHSELIVAASTVATMIPQAHFVIIGNASTPETQVFKDQLVQMIVSNHLSDRFHFTGFCPDIPRVIRAIDVLTVPSWSEPFGRVIVEGQAAGCPVIATAVGGVPEIVQDGINGLLIPPKDPTQLASAIIRLAKNRVLRKNLQEAGLHSAQRFGNQIHVDQVQALYDKVLNN